MKIYNSRPLLITTAMTAAALLLASWAHAQPPLVADDVQTDGQILQAFLVLNQGEILQAEMALAESEDPTLSDIARTIMSDHRTAISRIEAIAASGVTLEDSTLSAALQVESTRVIESLSGLSGAEFTCRYLQAQVEQREHALTHLLPQLESRAQSEPVKELVAFSVPLIERHLDVARTPSQATANC